MYYQRHQTYQVDDAVRVLSESIADTQMYMNTIDAKITDLDVRATCGLVEGEDFSRILIADGASSAIAFHCRVGNEIKAINIEEIITKFETYEQRISELEERLAQYDFYNENVA